MDVTQAVVAVPARVEAAAETQMVMGFAFPTGPGPARVRFRDEGAKWRQVCRALQYVSDCLGSSDRGFYRSLIGVQALAMVNARDRSPASARDLEEPELPWLEGRSGR